MSAALKYSVEDLELAAALEAAERFRERYRDGLSEDDHRELAAAAARAQNGRAVPSSEEELAETLKEATANVLARFADLAPCPRCGKVEREQDRAICDPCQAAIDHARRLEIRAKQLDGAVGEKFKDCRLDFDGMLERVHDARYLEQGRQHFREPYLAFLGPSGAGKTSLAVAMMRAWQEHTGELALIIHATRLVIADLSKATLPMEYVGAPLVIVDDLGEELDPGGRAPPGSLVKKLLHERYIADRPTWVTTWLDHHAPRRQYANGPNDPGLPAGSTVSGCYGDGIARRILGGLQIHMGGR